MIKVKAISPDPRGRLAKGSIEVSFKIVEDKMVRFVRVEHRCIGRGITYIGSTRLSESSGKLEFSADPNATYCSTCGEKFPRTVEDIKP